MPGNEATSKSSLNQINLLVFLYDGDVQCVRCLLSNIIFLISRILVFEVFTSCDSGPTLQRVCQQLVYTTINDYLINRPPELP